jgi:hypothetical protein
MICFDANTSRDNAEPFRIRFGIDFLVVLLLLVCSQLLSVSEAHSSESQEALLQSLPVCPSSMQCVELALHMGQEEGQSVADAEWLTAQLERANALFAPANVAFFVGSFEWLEEHEARVSGREERDLLGRSDFSKGPIHVYVVARLDNVDEEGEIYGVHWRDREARGRRWVIVSAIAWPTTLGHELGHFFGLPHSTAEQSVMNKSSEVAWSERKFVDDELETIEKQLSRMLKKKQLVLGAAASTP